MNNLVYNPPINFHAISLATLRHVLDSYQAITPVWFDICPPPLISNEKSKVCRKKARTSWLRDCPQNFIFALEASLPGQIFIFPDILSRGHYQPTYQPPEGVYLLNVPHKLNISSGPKRYFLCDTGKLKCSRTGCSEVNTSANHLWVNQSECSKSTIHLHAIN